jgi:UDP-glucose 4-epimerase
MNNSNYWKGKKILLTGGGGFIGSHLAANLVDKDADILILDNFSEGSVENISKIKDQCRISNEDLRYYDWQKLFLKADFDFIFHFAGNANVVSSVEKPGLDYQSNLFTTFSMIDKLREIHWPGKLIFSSSAAVYGNPDRIPIKETDPILPISPYGVSKLACERYLSAFNHLYGLSTASMRSFSAYGPRLKKQVVYDMICKLIKDPNELMIFGDGTQTRDFIYVDDIVQAALVISEKGAFEGEVYNVATGKSTNILDLAKAIAAEMKVKPIYKFTGAVRNGEPENWSVDIKKISALGFQAKIPLEKGLVWTYQWIKQQNVTK